VNEEAMASVRPQSQRKKKVEKPEVGGEKRGVAAALGGTVKWGTEIFSVKWTENEHNLNFCAGIIFF